MDLITLTKIMTENARHIAIINDEMGGVQVDLAVVKTNVDWLCKFFWLLAGGITSQFLFQLFHYNETRKNNKNNK